MASSRFLLAFATSPLLFSVAAFSVAACSGSAPGDPIAAIAGGIEDGGADGSVGSPEDAGGGVARACLDAAGPDSYKTPASGTLHGSGVDATFCTSAYLQLFSVVAGPPAHFVLNAFDATSVDITNPEDGSDPYLFVNVGIGAAAPGVYKSTDPQKCGGISFDYDLPVPKGFVCSGTPPTCSSGCSSDCSGAGGCTPCEPVPPGMSYEATVAQDCIDGTAQTVAGSWTVTLTSVEPYGASAATDDETYYVVHGTIEGTLPEDADGGAGSAAFALTF